MVGDGGGDEKRGWNVALQDLTLTLRQYDNKVQEMQEAEELIGVAFADSKENNMNQKPTFCRLC